MKKGKVQKDKLTSSPFCIEFEYGAQHKGYWTYDHFVLQCEDVADCLAVLHPEISFHLCIDHLCGHDRQRDDGLDASKMNKLFGCKQRVCHQTKIVSREGYLGPFPAQLNVGDKQLFEFTAEDNGPFWLTPAARQNRQKDVKKAPVVGEW